MHPIFFSIEPFSLLGREWGPYDIHSYGVLTALGFLLGAWVFIRLAMQDDIDPGKAIDFAFWLLVSGLLGSRVLFLVVNSPDYWNACFHPGDPNPLNNGLPFGDPDCTRIFKIWEGGLVWYGGLLGALLVSHFFLRRHKIPFAQMADSALGAVPLGHFIGRLGCLCAGCCFGSITDGPWGVVFPNDSLPYVRHTAPVGNPLAPPIPLPIHPVQLYEAFGELAIFLLLLLLRRRRRFYGQVALGYLILYPLLRFGVEFFRGDVARGLLIQWKSHGYFGSMPYTVTSGISTSQVISIFVALGALVWMAILLRKRKHHP